MKKVPEVGATAFYSELQQYLKETATRFISISSERKTDLAKVADYIRERVSKSEPAKVTFICTHNSRRSHLAQIWAQIAAEYYGLNGVETYSGGTEATAFNPLAIAALQRCGLQIVADDPTATNPRYRVYTTETAAPQICFSKVYHALPNPTAGYCAVMTCSEADEACPLVLGCNLRVPIRYEDPKVADDTPSEAARYDERSAQICAEMFYLMSLARSS